MIDKFLYQPTKPWFVGQKFGADEACYNPTTSVVTARPTGGVCPSGTRSPYPPGGHTGIDVHAPRFTPLYASHPGIVTEVNTEIARGLGVGITTLKPYFCKETGKEELFKTRYWHLIAIAVALNQAVKTGDLIGYADNTGYSAGDHLHYELKPVIKSASGEYVNILQENGTYGSVDPIPYMLKIYALDGKRIIEGLFKTIPEQLARLSDRIGDLLRGYK